MRRIRQQILSSAVAVLCVILSACSTTTGTTQGATNKGGATFNNILVIGVANDYEGRTRFERKLASKLKEEGAAATPLYVAAGGNKPFEREAIEELVKANGYDAVLISRVLNRNSDATVNAGTTATKAVRKDGGPVNLFRYDYEELNEPVTFSIDLSVTLSTELFETTNSERMWAMESTISRKENLDDLVNEAAETIARRLKKERLVGS